MVIVHSISCPIAYVIAFLASTEYWQLILVPSTIVVASTSLCFHGGLHLIAIDDFWKRTVPMASVEEGRLAQHHCLLRIPNYVTTLRDDRPGGIILYTNALWGCCIIVSVSFEDISLKRPSPSWNLCTWSSHHFSSSFDLAKLTFSGINP